MRNWEEQLLIWSQAPSKAEQEKCERTVREISNSLKSYPKLVSRKLDIFPQGSFAHRAYVRKDSDVDVCSLCGDTFYYELPLGKLPTEYGFESASYKYLEYKDDVEAALVAKFGRQNVKRGNKAIDVNDKLNLIDADVVATFELRDYRFPAGSRQFVLGTGMYSDDRKFITNFPRQQYDNGVAKHDATNRRFKRQVRIQKSLRNEMEGNRSTVALPIKSFLLESLCWNAPNHTFPGRSYFDDFENVTRWIYAKTENDVEAGSLLEVNGIKRLFGPHNSWTRSQVRAYVEAAWAYTH